MRAAGHGPAGGLGWPLGVMVSGVFGLAMAQISSAFPTAGGLYHWSSILGGRGWGWATAWIILLGLIFVVAIFGGAVMTLSWGLLFKLMPPGDRGAISGLATTTKGIGLIFGMLLAGIVIDVMRPRLPATEGYQVLWPILAVPILLAIPLVFSLIRAEEASDAQAASNV